MTSSLYSAFVDDAEFSAVIGAARNYKMKPEEQEEQRRSFAHGNATIENPRITCSMRDDAAERIEREKERAAEE